MARNLNMTLLLSYWSTTSGISPVTAYLQKSSVRCSWYFSLLPCRLQLSRCRNLSKWSYRSVHSQGYFLGLWHCCITGCYAHGYIGRKIGSQMELYKNIKVLHLELYLLTIVPQIKTTIFLILLGDYSIDQQIYWSLNNLDITYAVFST